MQRVLGRSVVVGVFLLPLLIGSIDAHGTTTDERPVSVDLIQQASALWWLPLDAAPGSYNAYLDVSVWRTKSVLDGTHTYLNVQRQCFEYHVCDEPDVDVTEEIPNDAFVIDAVRSRASLTATVAGQLAHLDWIVSPVTVPGCYPTGVPCVGPCLTPPRYIAALYAVIRLASAHGTVLGADLPAPAELANLGNGFFIVATQAVLGSAHPC